MVGDQCPCAAAGPGRKGSCSQTRSVVVAAEHQRDQWVFAASAVGVSIGFARGSLAEAGSGAYLSHRPSLCCLEEAPDQINVGFFLHFHTKPLGQVCGEAYMDIC